jgi:hypothetical protein
MIPPHVIPIWRRFESFPSVPMNARCRRSRRSRGCAAQIAALQHVILKERSAFAANEGPKLAEALCAPPPSPGIPLHPGPSQIGVRFSDQASIGVGLRPLVRLFASG